MVRMAVDRIVRVVGVKRPGEEKIKEAPDVVKGYKRTVKRPQRRAKLVGLVLWVSAGA